MSRDATGKAGEVAARAAQAAGVDHLTSWVKPARGQLDPAREITFYLGFHQPRALEYSPVPLFIALPRLRRYACTPDRMPKAFGPWALDSGGFTQIQRHGQWLEHPDSYGSAVVRILDECGWPPDFAAPQDWMCEPWVVLGGRHDGQDFHGSVFAHLGLRRAVRVHQELTVENYCYLREQFPMVAWIPVLQGWTLSDYLRCVDLYAAAGVDLTAEHRVGLGSVCRRESTGEAGLIASTLAGLGLRLHGFGFKTDGLREHAAHLASADSQAWSRVARLQHLRLPQCTHRARYCNNCLVWASVWRERIMAALREPRQQGLVLDATTSGTARPRPHRASTSSPVPAPGLEQLVMAL
jgi:hypothetical protein